MSKLAVWIGAVIAAGCGAAIGVLFSVAHRAMTPLWGHDFPYGLVLGLVSSIALLAAMRLLWDGRIPVIGAGIGLVAAILTLSLQGPGGSVLVANDALGWTWLIGPALAALVAIAWPGPRRGRGGAAGADGARGAELAAGAGLAMGVPGAGPASEAERAERVEGAERAKPAAEDEEARLGADGTMDGPASTAHPAKDVP